MNEQTSANVAALAASILRDPHAKVLNQSLRQTIEDIQVLAASCLTQAQNRPEEGDDE